MTEESPIEIDGEANPLIKIKDIIVKLSGQEGNKSYTMPANNLYEEFSKNIEVSMSRKFGKVVPLVIRPKTDCTSKDLESLIQLIKNNLTKEVEYFYIVFTFDVNMSLFVDILKEEEFNFHHMSEEKHNPPRKPSIVFFYDRNIKTGHQKVQAYSTSIQGVGAYLVSSDGYIIAAKEGKKMKSISGAIDDKKSVLATLTDELKEEVGYEINREKTKIYFLSGWVKPIERDEKIADNFHQFIIKVHDNAETIINSFDNKTDDEVAGIAAFKLEDLRNFNFEEPTEPLVKGDFKFEDLVYTNGKKILKYLHKKYNKNSLTDDEKNLIKTNRWLKGLGNFLFDGNALEVSLEKNGGVEILNNRMNVLEEAEPPPPDVPVGSPALPPPVPLPPPSQPPEPATRRRGFFSQFIPSRFRSTGGKKRTKRRRRTKTKRRKTRKGKKAKRRRRHTKKKKNEKNLKI